MTPSMQDVGLAVKQLQWRHHREANRRLNAQAGLSLVQWDVLRHVHRSPDASLHELVRIRHDANWSAGSSIGAHFSA